MSTASIKSTALPGFWLGAGALDARVRRILARLPAPWRPWREPVQGRSAVPSDAPFSDPDVACLLKLAERYEATQPSYAADMRAAAERAAGVARPTHG